MQSSLIIHTSSSSSSPVQIISILPIVHTNKTLGIIIQVQRQRRERRSRSRDSSIHDSLTGPRFLHLDGPMPPCRAFPSNIKYPSQVSKASDLHLPPPCVPLPSQMSHIYFALLVILLSWFSLCTDAATVWLAGDSTAASRVGALYLGWGSGLQAYLTVPVQNMAVAGKSLRSFTTDGHCTRHILSRISHT